MSFAENINRIQAERGDSNYRLAKEIGVSQTTIANWKAGRVKPLPVYIEKAAQYFGVSTDELTKGGEQGD